MQDPDGASTSEKRSCRILVFVLLGVLAGVLIVGIVLAGIQVLRPPVPGVLACANNLKQVGWAAQMYLNDHGVFPLVKAGPGARHGDTADGYPPGFPSIQLLFDRGYMDMAVLVVCPASTEVPATMDASGRYTLTRRTCSYLWNPSQLTDRDPSSTPLAACHHAHGGWNVLFIQGYVKWVTDREFEKSYRNHFVAP